MHLPDWTALPIISKTPHLTQDLRILVLRRGIVDMIVSTVFRRNFSTLEEQVASLTDNALALHLVLSSAWLFLWITNDKC